MCIRDRFSSDSKGQKVCIKATDRKGNENTKCSNAFMIDGTEPTLKDITLTPEAVSYTHLAPAALPGAEGETGFSQWQTGQPSKTEPPGPRFP